MLANRLHSAPVLAISPLLRTTATLFAAFFLLLSLSGCARFQKVRHERVYVCVQKKYLRDRIAAVSNRVAEVQNGQQLEVLDHWRRFLKVRTENKTIGWIEENAVITSDEYEGFTKLAEQHQQDPVVASGVIRDDATLHLQPGRDTAHFFYLQANDKVQLFARTSVPKKLRNAPPAPVTKPAAKPAAPTSSSADAKPATEGASSSATPAAPAPEPPPMEDWWLVRDGHGHIGWVMATRVDVDVPEEIGTYSEGQRIVGAYILKKLVDPEANTPNHEVTEWLTVLSPPKAGLPYDFDQVRVFIWSLKHHRYETAFRLRPLQGYLPVKVQQQTSDGQPIFSIQIGNDENLAFNPTTGTARPANMRTLNFVLADNVVRRIGPDFGPIPTIQAAEKKKAEAKLNRAIAKAKTNAKKK